MDWIAGVSYPWVLATLMILHCIIGMTAAIAAQKQGRPFGPWIAWGLLGGSVALIAVLVKPPSKSSLG
jgi:hypothetical protein